MACRPSELLGVAYRPIAQVQIGNPVELEPGLSSAECGDPISPPARYDHGLPLEDGPARRRGRADSYRKKPAGAKRSPGGRAALRRLPAVLLAELNWPALKSSAGVVIAALVADAPQAIHQDLWSFRRRASERLIALGFSFTSRPRDAAPTKYQDNFPDLRECHCGIVDALMSRDRALTQHLADPFLGVRVKDPQGGWTIMKRMLKCLLMSYEKETYGQDL